MAAPRALLLISIATLAACRGGGEGPSGPVAPTHPHASPPARLETPASFAPSYVVTTEPDRLSDAERSLDAAHEMPSDLAGLVRVIAAEQPKPVLLRGFFLEDTLDRSGFVAADRTARLKVGFTGLAPALFSRVDARVAKAYRSGLAAAASDEAASVDLLVVAEGVDAKVGSLPPGCRMGCARLTAICWLEDGKTTCHDDRGAPVP